MRICSEEYLHTKPVAGPVRFPQWKHRGCVARRPPRGPLPERPADLRAVRISAIATSGSGGRRRAADLRRGGGNVIAAAATSERSSPAAAASFGLPANPTYWLETAPPATVFWDGRVLLRRVTPSGSSSCAVAFALGRWRRRAEAMICVFVSSSVFRLDGFAGSTESWRAWDSLLDNYEMNSPAFTNFFRQFIIVVPVLETNILTYFCKVLNWFNNLINGYYFVK